MKAAIVFCAVLATAIAAPSVAQQHSCTDLEWDEQIASIYDNVGAGCEDVVEVDGTMYGRFKATFVRQIAGDVTLRFQMPDGTGVMQTFRPPEDFRVRFEGKQVSFHNLERGQPVVVLLPEKG